jgi:hypothetical protein
VTDLGFGRCYDGRKQRINQLTGGNGAAAINTDHVFAPIPAVRGTEIERQGSTQSSARRPRDIGRPLGMLTTGTRRRWWRL